MMACLFIFFIYFLYFVFLSCYSPWRMHIHILHKQQQLFVSEYHLNLLTKCHFFISSRHIYIDIYISTYLSRHIYISTYSLQKSGYLCPGEAAASPDNISNLFHHLFVLVSYDGMSFFYVLYILLYFVFVAL